MNHPTLWGQSTFAAAQYAEEGGHQRQQANKHNRMRRGDVLQGQRREQGKADHHP